MRKLFVTFTLAILAMVSFAQIPQTFSYQAVVRDAENQLIVSKPMIVELSILQGSDDGMLVYSEKHVVTSNQNGLISLKMGAGVSSDDFSAIDWSNAPYFVKTEIEIDGKTIVGVTPLLAVPYALYAAKAGSADVDLSNYATKDEIPSTEGFATKEELNALNIPSVEGLASESYVDEKVAAIEIPSTEGFATKEDLNALNIPSVEGLASESYVDEKVAAIEIPSTEGFATKEELNALNIPSVEGLASESYVDEKVSAIEIPSVPTKVGELENDANYITLNDVPATDLSGYYTKSDVDGKIADYATKEELNALNIPSVEGLASESYVDEKVAAIEIPEVDLSNYYLKADVDALLTELNAKINKLDKQLNPPIRGKFSVSADKRIYFSQGNLQYQASTGTWRFAEHQYDMIGSDNSNISSSYSGWIDLFGWGTSGYNSLYPYSNDNYAYAFEGVYTNIGGTNYDWGVYNKISNGGNQAGQWRTLTTSEWDYVISKRTDAASKKGFATVSDVTGLILLPDNWTQPDEVAFTSGANGDYTQNTYTTSEWSKMEANGAVFLPAAGYRDGANVINVGTYGYYWSSSYIGYSSSAVAVGFYYLNVIGNLSSDRYNGYSVRVVQDVEE